MFRDRIDAAFQLADALQAYKNQPAVVIAIPRGGVPMGAIIAKTLNLPLEVILTKKIGHPHQKEYSIGTITLTDRLINAPEGVSEAYIERETKRIRSLLQERYNQYYSNHPPISLKNKIVLLIDDGVATGNTLRSAIKLTHQQNPLKIVVAVPVASPRSLKKIKDLPYVDEVICFYAPDNFQAVGQFYKEFQQVTDEAVIDLLTDFRKETQETTLSE